jgi:hypothetical protein
MLRLNPFNLILVGLGIYFLGSLGFVYTDHGHAWILARFGSAGCFFLAFFWQLRVGAFCPEHRKFAHAFLALLFYVACISFPDMTRFLGFAGWRAAFANAAVMYGFFAFGLTLMTLNYRELMFVLKALFAASVAMFVILIPRFDVQWVTYVASRGQALMELEEGAAAYHYQMSLSYIFLSMFLISFSVRMRIWWHFLAVGSLGFVLITAFYYSKRATLLDLVVTLALFFVFYGLLAKHIKGVGRWVYIFGGAALAMISLSIAALFFEGGLGILADRLFGRVEEFTELTDSGGLMEFSRIYEARMWFEQANVFVKIFGGGTHHYHISHATGEWTQGLHIGWAGLYLKGGAPLVFFFIWVYFYNIKTAFRVRSRPSFIVGLTLPLLYASSMLHSGMFGHLHASFGVALSLFLFPALYNLENRGGAPVGQTARVPLSRSHPPHLGHPRAAYHSVRR